MHNSRVFICYASDDKERFVKSFAEKLRNNGVDASYDEWELDLGDSLIDIFDNIDESDALCIIISKFSVESNWIKEELAAGITRKITKGTKIIPIIIDKVPLPNSLKHINYIIINNIEDYENEFDEILQNIYGKVDKPPLGNLPLFLGNLSHLDKQELDIFKSIGEYCLKNYGFNMEVLASDISLSCDYNEEQIAYSLKILVDEGLLVSKGSSEGFAFTSHAFTINGFYIYFKTFIEDYEVIYKNVIKSIVNDNESINSIIQDTQVQESLVRSLLWLFKEKEFIICNAQFNIIGITPIGKNYFKKEIM